MYWHSSDYDRMAQLVIDVYIDYNLTTFPIGVMELCPKLGVLLIPYSAYDDTEDCISFSNLTNDAFYIPASKQNGPIIVYNDRIVSKGRIRFSVSHELKHYVNDDKEDNPYDENMADYFARYLLCPIPVLIYRGVNDVATIISDYNVSADVANHVLRNLQNRRRVHGNKIFDFEKPLIELIKSAEGGGLF